MKRRHTEEQIVAILREQEAGAKTADVGRIHLCLLASRCLHRFCKDRKALEALSPQIVSLFSPDCHDKTTKSAFLLPNGVGVRSKTLGLLSIPGSAATAGQLSQP